MPDDTLDILAAQFFGKHIVETQAEAIRDSLGETAVPRLPVRGRCREDLEAELARLFLPAPILADPLRRGPLGGEAGVTGIDEQNQAIDVRMGAIGILDLLNDVDAGVRVRDTRRIERLEEVVVADECPVPN